MRTGERFLLVFGNPKVLRALGLTVLLYMWGFLIVFGVLSKAGKDSSLILVVLCGVPIAVAVDYLRGRPGNFIETVEEVAEEMDQKIGDGTGDPEDRRIYSSSSPVSPPEEDRMDEPPVLIETPLSEPPSLSPQEVATYLKLLERDVDGDPS